MINTFTYSSVDQRVDQLSVKQWVAGAEPARGANFIIKIICICELFSERKKFKRYTLSGSNPRRVVRKRLLGIVKLWIATYNFYLIRGIA